MTTKKWIALSVAILSFVAAFLILYDQYASFGIWFQIEDVHHEAFAMFFNRAMAMASGETL
jgi:hypothetical protein